MAEKTALVTGAARGIGQAIAVGLAEAGAEIPFAEAEVDRVIGIGQNRPLAIFMPSQTPSQSARVMKPSSGVKPPIPSMIVSPVSRELMTSLGRDSARFSSSSRSLPSRSKIFNESLP